MATVHPLNGAPVTYAEAIEAYLTAAGRRCILSGDASPACWARDQQFLSGRSLIRASMYLPACRTGSRRVKWAASRPVSSFRFLARQLRACHGGSGRPGIGICHKAMITGRLPSTRDQHAAICPIRADQTARARQPERQVTKYGCRIWATC